MSKIITDEKIIEEILTRGVEQIFPDKETLKKKLMSGERIRLYCGYDPTAPSLHIGHAITINKLAQFQELGHEVIFLIGDFTCMIGDPTDKMATRKKMTREEVLKNAKDYQKQVGGYLKFDGENPAILKYNSEWNDKLTFRELIGLSSHFTVQQMIQRDMFQKRLEQGKPIYLHEFLYPLTQGYDSVAMDVDLEIGGNDQMFNMLAGRTLQRAKNNKEKFVLTLKLLADDSGKKMGKSEGNAVFLDQAPEEMYGAVMSWTDGVIIPGFELITNLPMEEIEVMKNELNNENVNPRDLKMKLAHELVNINYGPKPSEEAQENFEKVFSKREIPDEVISSQAPSGTLLRDLMISENLAMSGGDAKRKIVQGGVSLDGKIIDDINYQIKDGDEGKILKVGKREFRKISIK